MRYSRPLITPLLFALGASLSTGAIAASPEAREVEITVVTGTRTEKKLHESPVSIDVIAGEDIEAVTVGTLEKALELIPGVYFDRSEKQGYNILMRGFDGDRVLVLVDGQRLVSPTGSSVDFAQISALRIKRIEVVKGAASALYGSEAMGGVINIITEQSEGSELRLTQKSGMYSNNAFDEYNHHSNLLGSLIKSTWGLEGSYQIISDPNFRHNQKTDDNFAIIERESNLAQLQLSLNHETMSGRYKIQVFNEDKYEPRGRFANSDSLNFYITEVDRITHSLIANWGKHEIKGQSVTHDEISGNRGSLRSTDIFLHEIENQYAFGSEKLEWVSGGRIYQEGLNQVTQLGVSEVENEKRAGGELFLQGDYFVKDNIEIVAGGRAQEDQNFGFHSAFRTNAKINFNLPKNQLVNWRVHAGEGYRVPNIKENKYIFDHRNLGYMVIGNPELVPEESKSVGSELEYIAEFGFSTQLTASIGAHYTTATDYITTGASTFEEASAAIAEISNSVVLGQQDANYQYSQYINIENTHISGFDIDFSLNHNKTRYNLSYNYLDARDSDTNIRLEARPYHQIKTSVNTQFIDPNIEIMVYATYQNDAQEPSDNSIINNEFSIVNFSLKHQLFDSFSWKIGADNLFDVHQKLDIDSDNEFDARPRTGRFIYLSFDYQLH